MFIKYGCPCSAKTVGKILVYTPLAIQNVLEVRALEMKVFVILGDVCILGCELEEGKRC